MTHKDPEARREYHRRWREARRERVARKLCACGCGEMIPVEDGQGRPLIYANRHRPKLPTDHVPKRVVEAPMIECACGCGGLLPDRNRHGNKQRYIYGHTANKRWPTENPPPKAPPGSESDRAFRNRRLKWSKKIAVLRHYGGEVPVCACCGETNPIFLAIDHSNGGGNKHRRELGGSASRGGYAFYLWLIRSGFPEGFRVLCHNCNMAIGMLGYCPHQPPEVDSE